MATDHIPVWTFGERLAKARREAGIRTQAEMAEKMGVGEKALASWEADRSQPRDLLELVATWAKITGTAEAWLLGVLPHERRGTPRVTYRGKAATATDQDEDPDTRFWPKSDRAA